MYVHSKCGLTIEQAKNLKKGQMIQSTLFTGRNGKPELWKVTSVKTWKRDPNRIRIGLKRGLYQYGCINHESELWQFEEV